MAVAMLMPSDGMESVYVSVYVANAKTGDVHRKLRQTETRNLWFGVNLPELWGFPARLWIRRVLVRAQEGQLS